MLQFINPWIEDFFALFYPKYCYACGKNLVKNEIYVCSDCELHLSKTDFHEYSPNPMEMLFWGRTKIEGASAYFYFKKGSGVQSIIHQLKYKGHKELGTYYGKFLGQNILTNNILSSVDALIPIPLHPKKQKKRGYNQSEAIADGIASVLEKPVLNSVLARKVFTSTQTKLGIYQRWENLSDVFEIKNREVLKGKHLLIVDDVITTGATMEAAAMVLLEVPGVRVSLAALAFDRL